MYIVEDPSDRPVGLVRFDVKEGSGAVTVSIGGEGNRFDNNIAFGAGRYTVACLSGAADGAVNVISNNIARFEGMDKRFSMMFAFMTVGFVVLTTLITVYQFLG